MNFGKYLVMAGISPHYGYINLLPIISRKLFQQAAYIFISSGNISIIGKINRRLFLEQENQNIARAVHASILISLSKMRPNDFATAVLVTVVRLLHHILMQM